MKKYIKHFFLLCSLHVSILYCSSPSGSDTDSISTQPACIIDHVESTHMLHSTEVPRDHRIVIPAIHQPHIVIHSLFTPDVIILNDTSTHQAISHVYQFEGMGQDNSLITEMNQRNYVNRTCVNCCNCVLKKCKLGCKISCCLCLASFVIFCPILFIKESTFNQAHNIYQSFCKTCPSECKELCCNCHISCPDDDC
ncbi:MAG TPA: hypothetical protein VLG50_04615 [Candidatus Saccharimonadales bacterium]|nr:hypothetical protein [Candidatus Saccharimonadales bacterium]